MGTINTTSIPQTEPKKKRNTALFQISIVGIIIAVVAISFGFNVLSAGNPKEAPGTFAGMKLGNFVEGSQALTQVNKLHGTSIDLESAYIAEYAYEVNPYHSTDYTRVIVWAGKARSNDAAALLDRMVTGIGKGTTAFNNMQKVTLAGTDIYQVNGQDGEHFFYQSLKSPERVIWLIIQEARDTVSLVEQAVYEF